MKLLAFSGIALAATMVAAACTSSTVQNPPAQSASIRDSCIDPRQIDNQTIVSDQEIRFKLWNGEVWTNKLPSACSGLRIAGGFSWVVRGTLVCSNQQRITVKDTGTPCQLGAFSRTP